MRFIDPSGHWSKDVTANWTINEAKQKWAGATTQGEKEYWESFAEGIRGQLRQAGYSKSDIMQTSDAMLSHEEVMRQAREARPFAAFASDLFGAAMNYPGEAAVVGGVSFFASRIGKGFEKGLNFTATTVKRMETVGRFVPAQTLQAVIKYGKEFPDPQGTGAKMYRDIMYKTVKKELWDAEAKMNRIYYEVKKYNIEVLYDKATNTVLHFVYSDKPFGK
ncbi:hypothetical protein D5F52_08140 [Brevibacillus laterosporus]|nr:hypothetical protein [Brevibacillus laterosporus]AYB38243.1 hypothetical protein D5F52_08140 [Brevibacillus laterosporus]MBM7111484.1 hypothetical protein [Brevibacillus laterosporus]PPA86073.1 hypothetical protein C4A75_05585 [Brevibacillus laterosporus]